MKAAILNNPFLIKKSKRIYFPNLHKKHRWLLNPINYANLSSSQWEIVSALNFEIHLKGGGSWIRSTNTIRIGILMKKELYIENGRLFVWQKMSELLQHDIIHTVCHEFAHVFTEISDERHYENWRREVFPDNYPHHKPFYKQFMKICPRKYWWIEHEVYSGIAKTGGVPLEKVMQYQYTPKKDKRRKRNGLVKFCIEFSVALLLGFFGIEIYSIVRGL